MTTQEMIDNFLLQYDLNGSGAVAGFTDEEITEFLNKAQLDIVKKGFVDSGPELFPNIVKYHNFIMAVTDVTFNMPRTFTSGVGDFPADFLFYISSTSNITRTELPFIAGSGDWVENRLIRIRDLFKFRDNQSDKVMFYNPVVVLTDNSIQVAVDSDTTLEGDYLTEVNLIMGYLREPVTMILETTPGAGDEVDCELEDRWHQEIVDAALLNAMSTVHDVRIRGAKQSK